MLRLPTFDHLSPTTIDGVLEILAENPGQARLLAGGTDLLPNLKHGIESAETLVSLGRVPGLAGIEASDHGALTLGALVSLEDLAANEVVAARQPALVTAAGLVAGPHHRRMGTLGGNVCLNTRCVYINQSYFWREALGFCIKKDGTECHVVKGGKRCVAAASNDTAPVLMVAGAELLIASRERGQRTVPMTEFYVKDGVFNKQLEPDEMLLEVRVPAPAAGWHSAYAKLRPRESIDFPRLSVAVGFSLADGQVSNLVIVVSAMAATPLVLKKVSEAAEGQAPEEQLWDVLGQLAMKQCHPLTNIDGDKAWRREMVAVYVRRALREALATGSSHS
ncbi:MAG: 4-hydroxybenzoyl-CoA reductase subunit beta [Pseudohongiellaceae bacterium]|jgi:4-hydroxybenzoyl-CoA reductase subunit beta